MRAVWLLMGLGIVSASAADWPHVRGPAYNAVSTETGLAESWPEGGPPELWRVRLGQGYSGLVVVGERVYTQMQSAAGQFVVCLDAATGRRLWRHRYGFAWQADSDWPGPYATPTVVGNRVYFVGCRGLAGCLRARDGRRLWAVNVTEKFEGEGTEYGYACSPLVEGGRVFLPVGGEGASVVALSAADGSVAWQSGDEPASYSPACPVTVGGRRQIATFLQNEVIGWDPATGRQLWSYRWSESYDEHAAWPVYEEPYLLTAAAFRGGAAVLRLAADGTAELAWRSKVLSNDIFSSLVLDGHIYGFDLHDFQPRHTRSARGQLKCIRLATGEVRWATDRTGHANVLAADGKLILFNDLGELILARATPERYQELCRSRVFSGGVCWTAPSLSGKRLFVRNPREAVCLYLGDPAELGSTARPRRAAEAGGPTLWDRYVATCVGEALYAPSPAEAARWFGYCVGAVLLPAVAAGLAVARLVPRGGATVGGAVMLAAAFVLGALGTVALSAWTGAFTFTWPVCVFAAYQAVLWGGARARRAGAVGRWASRASMMALVGVCGVYVWACRSEALPNVPIGPGFLVGLLPALPMAVVAGRRLASGASARWAALWTGLSFAVYFWGSALFTIWRT